MVKSIFENPKIIIFQGKNIILQIGKSHKYRDMCRFKARSAMRARAREPQWLRAWEGHGGLRNPEQGQDYNSAKQDYNLAFAPQLIPQS